MMEICAKLCLNAMPHALLAEAATGWIRRDVPVAMGAMGAMRVVTRKSGRMSQADHDLSPGRCHEALAAWESAHSVSLTGYT